MANATTFVVGPFRFSRRYNNLVTTELGKLLLAVGGIILLIGAALLLAGRLHLPLGRLPGDIVYRGKNTVFYFPIVTCIVISVMLSLIFWLLGRGRH
jgi:hypothetical protein